MTNQELYVFAHLVMKAVSHNLGCPFTGCTCEAAHVGPAVYSQASTIARKIEEGRSVVHDDPE